MNIKVISFCTSGPYAEEAKRLKASAEQFGVDLNLVEYQRSFLPTWNEAVLYKPEFIYEHLRLWDSHDGVLWMDADSEFVRAPKWDTFANCDVAWNVFKRSSHHASEFLTGTMFFRHDATVMRFVREWSDATARWTGRDTPEQDSLQHIWRSGGWHDLLEHLDPSAAWCSFDDNPHYAPTVVHRQASRRLRQ